MAIYRYVHTAFWQDGKVLEEMTPEDKYFMLYLLTNPNTTQIGIYPLTKKQISFDMGYSIESAKALIDRFRDHHKIIRYNEETREIAIINWGRYNFNRGGKPIEDCVKKELKQVKDKDLIGLIAEKIENQKIKALYIKHLEDINDTYHDTGNDTYHDTPTIRGQKEKEKEKEKEEKICRKQNVSDANSSYMKMTQYLQDKILAWKPNAKMPSNLYKWFDEFRKLVEIDKRTEHEVYDVIDYATSDSFWQAHILSAVKLRSKFDQLQGQMMAWQNKVTQLPIRRASEPVRGNVSGESLPPIVKRLREIEEQKRRQRELNQQEGSQ